MMEMSDQRYAALRIVPLWSPCGGHAGGSRLPRISTISGRLLERTIHDLINDPAYIYPAPLATLCADRRILAQSG